MPLQTLVRLVREEDGGVFGPEDIAVMATAFDRLLADLKLVDRNDPVVTMLAKAKARLERAKLVIVAARERAVETAQQCAARPSTMRHPTVLQRRRLVGRFSGRF